MHLAREFSNTGTHSMLLYQDGNVLSTVGGLIY